MTGEQIDIRIIRSIHYENDNSWNYKINYYPYNTLYFVMDGDGFIRVGEQTIPLLPGKVYLIPANTQFSCWCETRIHKFYVDVSAEVVPGYDIFSCTGAVRQAVFPVAEIYDLIAANERNLPRNQLYLKGKIMQVISVLLDDDFEIANHEIFQYRTILTDIEQNLSSSLKVSTIAQKFGWNAVVLSRNFKRVFHCSLKAYIERLLVNRIKQELIITDKSIKEIASDYQFCDPYYMSNFFKRHERISPNQYRIENKP